MFNKACYKTAVKGLAGAALLLLASLGHAEAATWRQTVPELRATGSGRMSFLGLAVYDATLWTRDGWRSTEPFALELLYARSISREQLVNSSVAEMQRVGIARQQAEAWAALMRRVFVDVKAGDRLIAVFLPEQGVRFYSQQGLTGEVPDVAFARAFAAIWLDPRTREPELRRRLLGLSSP